MQRAKIINARLRAGLWTAELTEAGPDQPQLAAHFAGQALAPPAASYDDASGSWHLRLALPAGMISEGVQTLVISDAKERMLARLTLIAGDIAEDDLLAEISSLRAELELLKSAFRQSQHGEEG